MIYKEPCHWYKQRGYPQIWYSFWLGKYSFDNDGYQSDLIHGVF